MNKKLSMILRKQYLRFFLVAGLNTFFGYGAFALLIYFGLHYTLAVLISTVAGVLFNFKTYGLLVFNSKDNKLIFHFFGVYIVTYLCNVSGIALLAHLEFSNYMAGMIMALPIGFLGFILNKKFVFKT